MTNKPDDTKEDWEARLDEMWANGKFVSEFHKLIEKEVVRRFVLDLIRQERESWEEERNLR